MTPALCTCGHPQPIHFGPTGPCHAWFTMAEVEEGGSDAMVRCDCGGFVLAVPAVIAPELTRSDLQ